MDCRGELRIDPSAIETDGAGAEIELVVLHTEWSITAAVLSRAKELVAGLNAKLTLLAVHAVPYPAPLSSGAYSHARLVGELSDLASQSDLTILPHVVLARGREEGFRFILKAESSVLIGSRNRLWPTAEERLARVLAKDGHKVALIYV